MYFLPKRIYIPFSIFYFTARERREVKYPSVQWLLTVPMFPLPGMPHLSRWAAAVAVKPLWRMKFKMTLQHLATDHQPPSAFRRVWHRCMVSRCLPCASPFSRSRTRLSWTIAPLVRIIDNNAPFLFLCSWRMYISLPSTNRRLYQFLYRDRYLNG